MTHGIYPALLCTHIEKYLIFQSEESIRERREKGEYEKIQRADMPKVMAIYISTHLHHYFLAEPGKHSRKSFYACFSLGCWAI
jgi:hypothetical protein